MSQTFIGPLTLRHIHTGLAQGSATSNIWASPALVHKLKDNILP